MRRGSVEWSAETLGKLLLALLMIILLFMMAKALVGLFLHGEGDYRAVQNFGLLASRIEFVDEHGLSGKPEASVVIEMPENYLLLSFSKGDSRISHAKGRWRLGEEVCDGAVAKPEECSEDMSCLCVYRLSVVQRQGSSATVCQQLHLLPLACKELPYDAVQGTIDGDFEYERTGINFRISFLGREFFILASTHGPRQVRIRELQNILVLDASEGRQ